MFSLDDVWQWAGELKTSLPFEIALPIAVAIALATLADWIERYLTIPPKADSQQPAQAYWAGMLRHHPSEAPTQRPAVAMRPSADRF
jgi:hypothetical protein